MSYWWVNQTDNWQDEFKRGYLYAGESSSAYRKSILDVRKDDLVICTHGTGEKRRIYAIGIIAADPSGKLVPRRQTRAIKSVTKPAWPNGWEVPIDYEELESPVPWAPIRRSIQGKFVAKHFTEKSAGVQGYLFPVPPETAGEILRLVNREQPPGTRLAGAEVIAPALFATTMAAEVMVRVGHKKWSAEVKTMWGERCCATGFNVRPLLRASHIVSWSEDEGCRLHRHNGLCLSPAYDAAFDAHLITFQDDGRILLADEFSPESARQIGIDPATQIKGLLPDHLKYLERHRTVFRSKCSRP
jgi:putative restriction endonuclease